LPVSPKPVTTTTKDALQNSVILSEGPERAGGESNGAESKDPDALNPAKTARTIPPQKPQTTPANASISIELDRLRALDHALRRRVLRAAARQLGARLSFDETARLLALAGLQPYPPVGPPTVSARSGSSLHLSNNLRADRSLRELRLYRHP
jgi:tRNA(Ile)-lysidine synthase